MCTANTGVNIWINRNGTMYQSQALLISAWLSVLLHLSLQDLLQSGPVCPVSTGRYGQPSILLPTQGHCGVGTGWSSRSLQTQSILWFVLWSSFLLRVRKSHTSTQHWSLACAVWARQIHGLGHWPGTTLEACSATDQPCNASQATVFSSNILL